MSLSAREQHDLDSLEHRLAASDPQLASLLATFTRLTGEEALPARERIQAGRRRAARPRRVWPRRPRSGTGPSPYAQLSWPVLWLVVSVAMIAIALALTHGSARAGCGRLSPACAGQAPAWHIAHAPAPG